MDEPNLGVAKGLGCREATGMAVPNLVCGKDRTAQEPSMHTLCAHSCHNIQT